MAKIDYSKAEREINDALQRMRVKSLAEGKPVTSQRAAEYYGVDEKEPRPTPQEPVSKLVRIEAARAEAEEALQKLAKEIANQPPNEEKPAATTTRPPLNPPQEIPEEPEFLVVKQTPKFDVMRRARQESTRPPRFVAPHPADVPAADKFLEPTSPLYVLRQHLFWLKRRHSENRYELLGTTRDEVMAFRKTKRLNEDQLSRIKEINARAEEVKTTILSSEGVKSDEESIENQKRKHITKRFRIKDSWLPL